MTTELLDPTKLSAAAPEVPPAPPSSPQEPRKFWRCLSCGYAYFDKDEALLCHPVSKCYECPRCQIVVDGRRRAMIHCNGPDCPYCLSSHTSLAPRGRGNGVFCRSCERGFRVVP